MATMWDGWKERERVEGLGGEGRDDDDISTDNIDDIDRIMR